MPHKPEAPFSDDFYEENNGKRQYFASLRFHVRPD